MIPLIASWVDPRVTRGGVPGKRRVEEDCIIAPTASYAALATSTAGLRHGERSIWHKAAPPRPNSQIPLCAP